MILGLAGCGLFSSDNVVKLGDYTHEDPKDLKYDQRIVLKGNNFGTILESMASAAAYPDTTVYDEAGNPVGVYDYDETTGLAKGWMNMADGSFTAFEEGEEVDLGKPDFSKSSPSARLTFTLSFTATKEKTFLPISTLSFPILP